ncbi:MAG: shikimate kinase I [Actinobacteria bacterium]|nr:shikimate kinase I [Actinomycetota bacterium]
MWTSHETWPKVSPSNNVNKPPQYPSRIILVGMMGSGKSRLGRTLAKHIGYTFVDTDRLIETQTSARIPDLFQTHGESGFRDIESGICETLNTYENAVIATGGGMVLRPENQEKLRQMGWVVFLYTPLDILLSRLEKDRKRPLLQTEDREQTLTHLYQSRAPIYDAVAHVSIDTSSQRQEIILETLLKCLPDPSNQD